MPSGYLDTGVIIGLVQSDLGNVEMAAVVDLLELRKAGEIALCTSHVAKEELARHKAAGSLRVEDVVYMLLDDVPAVDEEFQLPATLGGAGFGSAMFGGGPMVRHEVLGRLMEILPGKDDARHIFQAARNGIDYFVTCDQRTILKHTAAIEATAGIRPRLPSQLVAELAVAAKS